MICPRCIDGQVRIDDDGPYCLQCGWHLWLNPYPRPGPVRWPPVGLIRRVEREDE